MSQEIVLLAGKVADQGLTALILFLAVYYVGRAFMGANEARMAQYESRIVALEAHVVQCEEHRLLLGAEIRELQKERINALERLLEEEREE